MTIVHQLLDLTIVCPEENMKNHLLVICMTLLFLAACSSPGPILPTATRLSLPTLGPNVTPASFDSLDLAPLLIWPGDLPAGLSGGQITRVLPDMYDEELSRSDNAIHQQLRQNGEVVGLITVFLYKSTHEIEAAYKLVRKDFVGSWHSPSSPIAFENKPLADVGEKAIIATIDDPLFRLVDIAFVRCKAVVHMQMLDKPRTTKRGRPINVVVTEATTYAKRLDQRLSQIVCP